MTPVTTAEPRPAPLGARTDATGWPVLPPTLLSVHRTSPRDEQSRQIVCKLDGRPIGTLLYGQECTVEIAPGPHVIRAHNTLVWRSLAFEAPPGAHVHFTVRNRCDAAYYPLIFLFGVAPLWLDLERGFPR